MFLYTWNDDPTLNEQSKESLRQIENEHNLDFLVNTKK